MNIFEKLKCKKSSVSVVYQISGGTDMGLCRENNEDDYVYNASRKQESRESWSVTTETERLLVGVLDGVGGEECGEEASAAAAVAMNAFYLQLQGLSPEAEAITAGMKAAAWQANTAICELLEEHHAEYGGCTLVAACILGNTAFCYSIGDSRIYLRRGHRLRQVTQDDTLTLQKSLFRRGYRSHVLDKYLGARTAEPDTLLRSYPPIFLKKKDVLLLCTDGLHDMCSKRELCCILSRKKENPAQALIAAALEHGGKDNVTCMVVQRVE